jgi:DNA-binding response OmpR family regulator
MIATQNRIIEGMETNSREANFYDDGMLRVEYDNYYIAVRGEMVRIQRTEFLVLSQLVKRSERYILAEELWDCVWGTQRAFNKLSTRVYVSRLRQLLEPFGIKIENMPNVGYRFIPYSKSL